MEITHQGIGKSSAPYLCIAIACPYCSIVLHLPKLRNECESVQTRSVAQTSLLRLAVDGPYMVVVAWMLARSLHRLEVLY